MPAPRALRSAAVPSPIPTLTSFASVAAVGLVATASTGCDNPFAQPAVVAATPTQSVDLSDRVARVFAREPVSVTASAHATPGALHAPSGTPHGTIPVAVAPVAPKYPSMHAYAGARMPVTYRRPPAVRGGPISVGSTKPIRAVF